VSEALLTRRAAARLLGLSVRAIDRRLAAGELPCVRLGAGPKAPVRIRPADLERYISGPNTGRQARTKSADLERERLAAAAALGGGV
jgi:excisionase family DNA binding protein